MEDWTAGNRFANSQNQRTRVLGSAGILTNKDLEKMVETNEHGYSNGRGSASAT